MKIFQFASQLNDELNRNKIQGKKIGFVPTMGALHKGHLSLIQKSQTENDLTVCSIFVNPTQFNNQEDLINYPSSNIEDTRLLQEINCDYLYLPDPKDVYPNGLEARSFHFGGLENEMEGAKRPGHFDGVATVVKRLLEITIPDRAYFGEKDFQQLQIVKKLVVLEQIPCEIIPCAIFREKNGLAMSSRNRRLNPAQLEVASEIYQSLLQAKSNFQSKTITELQEAISSQYKNMSELDLEYFEIADVDTLKPAKQKEKNKKYRAFIAVFAGSIRLIDNIDLN